MPPQVQLVAMVFTEAMVVMEVDMRVLMVDMVDTDTEALDIRQR